MAERAGDGDGRRYARTGEGGCRNSGKELCFPSFQFSSGPDKWQVSPFSLQMTFRVAFVRSAIKYGT